MTVTVTNNGNQGRAARKSLADQIDRLDRVLDGLADGLNEAVADAVKAAVTVAVSEAVRAVLAEVLASPEVLARLHATTATPIRPTTARGRLRSLLGRSWAGIRTWFCSACKACSQKARRLGAWCGDLWLKARRQLSTLRSCAGLVRQWKYRLLVALSIGLTIGVAAWLAGPWLSAVAGGIGGFTTTLAVQAGLWLRRVWQGIPVLDP